MRQVAVLILWEEFARKGSGGVDLFCRVGEKQEWMCEFPWWLVPLSPLAWKELLRFAELFGSELGGLTWALPPWWKGAWVDSQPPCLLPQSSPTEAEWAPEWSAGPRQCPSDLRRGPLPSQHPWSSLSSGLTREVQDLDIWKPQSNFK